MSATTVGDGTGCASARPAVAWLVLTVLALTSCGLPGGGAPQTVDDAAVPYSLLSPSVPGGSPTDPGQAPRRAPTVFWVDDDRVAPEATAERCDDDPDLLVPRLLARLLAGPSDEARARGRSSVVPGEFALELISIDDGTATIDIEPETSLSAEQLPLAVGQIVLTVTSVPTVRSVVLHNDGEQVPVPLPDGVLTETPTTAADYTALLPRRLRGADRVGCPAV